MLLLDTSVFLKVWLRPDEVSAKALREIADDAIMSLCRRPPRGRSW